jgi:hypothetical protein
MTRYRQVRVHSPDGKWTWRYAAFEDQEAICLFVPEIGSATLPVKRLEDLQPEHLGEWATAERVEIGPIQEHTKSPDELDTGYLAEMAFGMTYDRAPSKPKKRKRAVAKV